MELADTEILAGYSIQTNKNAKEELEARPVFLVNVSMVAGVSGFVCFLCYLKDFGPSNLPYILYLKLPLSSAIMDS